MGSNVPVPRCRRDAGIRLSEPSSTPRKRGISASPVGSDAPALTAAFHRPHIIRRQAMTDVSPRPRNVSLYWKTDAGVLTTALRVTSGRATVICSPMRSARRMSPVSR